MNKLYLNAIKNHAKKTVFTNHNFFYNPLFIRFISRLQFTLLQAQMLHIYEKI